MKFHYDHFIGAVVKFHYTRIPFNLTPVASAARVFTLGVQHEFYRIKENYRGD